MYLTTTGFLTSPGYPQNYPNKLDCTYLIQPEAALTITLTFHQLHIEEHHDFVRVGYQPVTMRYKFIRPYTIRERERERETGRDQV